MALQASLCNLVKSSHDEWLRMLMLAVLSQKEESDQVDVLRSFAWRYLRILWKLPEVLPQVAANTAAVAEGVGASVRAIAPLFSGALSVPGDPFMFIVDGSGGSATSVQEAIAAYKDPDGPSVILIGSMQFACGTSSTTRFTR